MPELEASSASSSKGTSASLPWWVRLCRWLWKIAVFLGVTVFGGLVVNILSTWLTTAHGALPSDTPLTTLMTHWPITVLTGCCLLLIAALAWVVSRQNPPIVQASLPTKQDRQRMQGRLRLRYEQMLAQSLQGVVQIELGLISRPAAVNNATSLSLHLPDQPEEPLPPHTSIREAYELAQQELLILGEPGAGKSTLLLELAHSLVEQSEQDITQPLPVLLPLSSWAVSRRPLQDWIAEQLTLLYDVPRSLGQQCIQAEQILPLLDGLDEMEASARAACIAAINIYHRDHLQPLVVCSRTSEFEMAARRERLALHTAVVVQPLSPEQVESHLANLGKPLAALRAALRKNTTLQELATTPLMLQVLILTYHGTSVRALSQKEAELREQVWTDYVERMVSRKGDARHYPLHVTITRLAWLAAEMRQHNQTIFFLEHLQPDWLPKRRRSLYQWSVGLLVGLAFGLVFGLLVGLEGGLVFGLLVGLRWKIEPAEALVWSWKGMSFGLLVGLLVGLLIGLFGGLLVGLVAGLLIGLLIGLEGGLSGEQLRERLTLSPNEGIQRSLKNGLWIMLVFELLVGLTMGLLIGLPVGLTIGLLVGLFGGLPVGLDAVIQHYILRFWLAQSGLFPWKAVPFLENATTRILLRHVGGGYSFVHQLLLDHFADLDPAAPPGPTQAHTTRPSEQMNVSHHTDSIS